MRRANERAGGLLFVHSIDYEETASVFLEKITQYAIKNKKYMFYTGANAENLVTQANRRLRKNQTSRPYRQSDYINALLESAKGKYSQPYGETNMSDIAEFWLRAYENKYANAGSLDLFPFSDYEKKECRFNQTAGQTEKLCAYDAYMYQCISEEITSLDKIRKGLN
jgi:hypothetical protein